MREIDIANNYEALDFDSAAVANIFHTLDASKAFSPPEGLLSIAFLTDPDLAQVHADFLNDPTTTDVITFPGDPQADYAGEILVSVDRALQAAPEHNNTFSNELTLYLVHGYLHLAGFLDKTEEEIAAMRSAEAQALQIIKSAHALPLFSI